MLHVTNGSVCNNAGSQTCSRKRYLYHELETVVLEQRNSEAPVPAGTPNTRTSFDGLSFMYNVLCEVGERASGSLGRRAGGFVYVSFIFER